MINRTRSVFGVRATNITQVKLWQIVVTRVYLCKITVFRFGTYPWRGIPRRRFHDKILPYCRYKPRESYRVYRVFRTPVVTVTTVFIKYAMDHVSIATLRLRRTTTNRGTKLLYNVSRYIILKQKNPFGLIRRPYVVSTYLQSLCGCSLYLCDVRRNKNAKLITFWSVGIMYMFFRWTIRIPNIRTLVWTFLETRQVLFI